jgi:uncharacterized repeat protein (TIGR03803 family)
MNNLMRMLGSAMIAATVVISVSASANALTFNTIWDFNAIDGAFPDYGSLAQGFNGNFYGTTNYAGAHEAGTVFEITAGGNLTTLYTFCSQPSCADGSDPAAGLIQAADGNLYGTTTYGGANSYGTVFKITASGKLTTLYSFSGTDGALPQGSLVQGSNGNFYGTTEQGGVNNDGTVFEITAGGNLTTLYSFGGTDGEFPYGALIQATNGDFYGTTEEGGDDNVGTVFAVTAGGQLTSLHSFNGSDGEYPYGALVQATNGNLYGTTEEGGAYGPGTVFEITAGGELTTIYNFAEIHDGGFPYGGLIPATNGALYGTTSIGGAFGAGTIFEISGGSKLSTILSFNFSDGEEPRAGLLQATTGIFYGTTSGGGTRGEGTVYSLGQGLGRFIEILTTSGLAGETVVILGNNLSGAASVTFNGKAAKFRVVSSTEITATVPKGAITGPVKVKTPSGTLTSNVNFRVS